MTMAHKTVTFLADVYPYCVGDVVVLDDDQLAAVDKIAKARKVKAYVAGAKAEVESSAEADRQAEDREAQEGVEDERKASHDLAQASAAAADDQPGNNPSGLVEPGTSGKTELKTAAAAGKKR